jgi:hypothetical protein
MEYGDLRLPERFWDKVQVVAAASTYPGPCWIWTATLRQGYGRFRWAGNLVSAHVLSWEVLTGRQRSEDLDHLCRVRCCVNPQHLEEVSRGENISRGIKGYGVRTTCKQGHDITDPNNHYVTPSNGKRQCKTCHDNYWRRYTNV